MRTLITLILLTLAGLCLGTACGDDTRSSSATTGGVSSAGGAPTEGGTTAALGGASERGGSAGDVGAAGAAGGNVVAGQAGFGGDGQGGAAGAPEAGQGGELGGAAGAAGAAGDGSGGCTPGEESCAGPRGTTLVRCAPDGHWTVPDATCPNICQDQCPAPPHGCRLDVDPEYRCNADTVERCVSGEWVEQIDCNAQGVECFAGACVWE